MKEILRKSIRLIFNINVMPIYKNNNSTLTPIKENAFKLEKDIQKLFEKNLGQIMNLEMVKSEFTIKNRRIDTLAYDPQNKAFVIIEYKRDKNYSVVDQGFSYLNLMLQYKADFVLEYNERLKKTLVRKDVDWSQTRIVFVSPGFTDNQREAVNFKDIAIELWEVKQYEQNIVAITQIKKSNSAESIKTIVEKNKELAEITNEIKVYTEEDHLQGKPDETVELYETFKNAILNLSDNIGIKPKKQEVGFTKSDKIFSDICIQKNNLKIFINLKRGNLDDPKKLARDVSSIGHWGNGDYQIQPKNTNHIEYIMSLVKQAL